MNRLMVILIALLGLSGCAVMDISFQETAVPTYPRKLDVSTYMSVGLDLNDLAYAFENEDEEVNLGGWFVNGIKANIPANKDMDFSARAYISSNTTGGRLGIKQLLMHQDNHYVAIAPALTIVRAMDKENNDDKYLALGLETQLLSSWQVTDFLTPTLGAKVNYHRFSKRIAGEEQGPWNLIHGGVMAGARLHAKNFYIQSEVGMEAGPLGKGRYFLRRNIGIGIGVMGGFLNN